MVMATTTDGIHAATRARFATSCGDADNDGCDDCVSGPNPASDGTDTDGDGACNAGDGDDDGDGIPDAATRAALRQLRRRGQ